MQSSALIVTSTPDIYPTIISTVVSLNLHMGKLRMENLINRPNIRQLVKKHSTGLSDFTANFYPLHFITSALSTE